MYGERCFTIFGGTGDLTFRKLIPAFYNLMASSDPAADTQIIIIGHRDYTSEVYRDLAKEWVKEFARFPFTEEQYQRLAERILYYRMDFTDISAYPGLKEFYQRLGNAKEHIFYFAVAPRFFCGIVDGLKKNSEAEKGKVVIEKPFGETLAEAEDLNKVMEGFFGGDKIYRIDHYLGKEMVRAVQTIRWANPIFKDTWDGRHIENIQISAMEELGVEKRGGYYDQSGALKDMMQNHLLQILTIVAMDKSLCDTPEEMYSEQIKVLKSLRPGEEDSVEMVLGQYEGYRREEKVAKDSNTETYSAIRLYIDNERWQGMPFYIRTGKKLAQHEMKIVVAFKSPSQEVEQNRLEIKIQPEEGVNLKFNMKKPGESDEIIQAHMDFCQSCEVLNQMNTPDAYERLIAACTRSEHNWFTQWEQIKLSWDFVDSLREKYAKENLPIYPYIQGSFGPEQAKGMLEADGNQWID